MLSRTVAGIEVRSLLVAVAAVAGGALVASTRLGWLAVVAVVLGVALFVMPARWLPVVGLLLFLSPFDRGPNIPEGVRLVLIALPLLVYFVRRRSGLTFSFGVGWVASWVVLVGGLSAFLGLRPLESAAYLLPVVVLVAVPLSLRSMPAGDQRLLVRAWAVATIALAAYGLVEFVLAANVLLDPWYALDDAPLVQKWDTYRIVTTIGHPLLNGMFFAAGFALFCWQLLERSAIGRKTAVVGIVASLGGTVLSGSRSALIAAAAGGVVVSLAATSQHPTHLKWAVRLILPVGLVGAFLYLQSLRLGGLEADSSLDDRRNVYGTAAQLIEQNWLLGAGPGNAWRQNELFGAFWDVPLESSALELLVGWGVLGVAVALVLAGVYAVAVLRRGRGVALAPMLAVVAASLFFNALEGDTKSMLLFCSVALLVAMPVRGRRPGAGGGTAFAAPPLQLRIPAQAVGGRPRARV